MRQHVRSMLGIGFAAAVLAACGSTAVEYPVVQVGPGGTTGSSLATTGDSLGTSGTTGGLASTGASGTGGLALGSTGTAGVGTAGGSSSGIGSTGSGGASATGGGSTGSAVNGNVRGVTKSTVKVGLIYSSDASTFQTTLNPNAVTGDPVQISKAIQNRINSEGGILGRKLEMVFHDQKISSAAANPTGEATAACTYFTQDNPVTFVIVNIATLIDTTCLARAKMPAIELNAVPADSVVMKPLYPYYHLAVSPDPAVLMPKFVDRLVAQGYFGGWDTALQKPNSSKPVIGVYIQDTPLYRRILDSYLTPALKKRGYSVKIAFKGDPNPFNRAGQENSAVLQFRQNGVTHLITLGPAVYTGAKGADGYHYRLSVLSENGPAGATAGAPEALPGAMGVGWNPAADVGPKGQGAATPSNNKCVGWVNKDLGYDVMNQPDRYGSVITKCDGITVFLDAMRAAGGYSAADIQRGLGLTFRKSPTAFMSEQGFTDTKVYGPSTITDLAYVQSCNCFRYGSTRTSL